MSAPIKRSPQLAPLSREHHEGLLFAWKIRQGLKNSTDHKLMASYIAWFWEQELQAHFKKEENILAPLLPNDNSLIIKMFSDHEEIEALVHVVAMIPDEDIFMQLADAVQAHIRFEEQQLFAWAEKEISHEKLAAIQSYLEDKSSTTKWTKEFWLARQDVKS